MKNDTGYLKVMVYGSTFEVNEYERMPVSGKGKRKGRSVSRGNRSEEYRMRSLKRAYDKIRRLCEANFDQRSKFLTLTFDSQLIEVTNIKTCNIFFKNFLKRLNDWFHKHAGCTKNIQYLAVVQFQDQNGRGAVHYHMLANMPFIDQQTLHGIWQNGSVNIQSIKDTTHVTNKILRYITRGIGDTRLEGQRKYLSSKNLEQPLTYIGDAASDMIHKNNLEDKQIKYSWDYNHEFLGHIKHTRYRISGLIQ